MRSNKKAINDLLAITGFIFNSSVVGLLIYTYCVDFKINIA